MEEAQSMMGGMNLFGNMPNQGAPRGAQGMPRNMNVNRRKVIRKKNNANKKDASKKDINKSGVLDESKD